MTSSISRLGIRSQLLIAPAVVLLLAAVLGALSYRQLDAAAGMAKVAAEETGAVETLRDSNTLQFEADRFQTLALAAEDQKEFDANHEEATDAAKEVIAGLDEFAAEARTPALRRDALAQAALTKQIAAERERALSLAKVGQPLPPAAAEIVAGVEELIEQADEGND